MLQFIKLKSCDAIVKIYKVRHQKVIFCLRLGGGLIKFFLLFFWARGQSSVNHFEIVKSESVRLNRDAPSSNLSNKHYGVNIYEK